MATSGWDDFTQTDVARLGRTRPMPPTSADRAAPKKAAKYRNQKIFDEREGWFDSTHEHEQWLLLKARQASGEIEKLRRQTAFDLWVLRPDGVREVIGKYTSDYDFWLPARSGEPARYVVSDAKQSQSRTEEYILS